MLVLKLNTPFWDYNCAVFYSDDGEKTFFYLLSRIWTWCYYKLKLGVPSEELVWTTFCEEDLITCEKYHTIILICLT